MFNYRRKNNNNERNVSHLYQFQNRYKYLQNGHIKQMINIFPIHNKYIIRKGQK